jgi:alkanesulfonate monooxygenase SsuD/methylene tetrahydromethanopterin reductase-like flavin-dependent oxidoreductase (luciferase family)
VKLTVMAYPQAGDPSGVDGVLSEIDAAASAGFSRVWVPQLQPAAGVASWDALTLLALGGMRTPDIELATGVVVAYTQHPLALARQALTVSAGLRGRLILGVGVSHRFLVSDMFGYSYSAPAAFLREYLQVLAQDRSTCRAHRHRRSSPRHWDPACSTSRAHLPRGLSPPGPG